MIMPMENEEDSDQQVDQQKAKLLSNSSSSSKTAFNGTVDTTIVRKQSVVENAGMI